MKLTPGVNFINILRTNFSYEHRFGSFSLVTCLVAFCFGKKFVRKTHAYNVDEIDFCLRITGLNVVSDKPIMYYWWLTGVAYFNNIKINKFNRL